MKKALALILAAAFLFLMAYAVPAEDENTEGDASENGVSVDDIKDAPEYNFKFETVAKNSEAELLIDKSVNALRLVSLKSGKYFDTKVLNGQTGNDFIKNSQKSDFFLTYYTDTIRANTTSVDNYSQSIALQQVEYTPIENGIRCSFLVGEANKLQLSLFPMYISKERMEELVLQYLTDEQKRELTDFNNGYYTETKDKYIRNWSATQADGSATPVPIPKLKRMYTFFYELGKYSQEELEKDNQEWGEETTNTNITMTVIVDYILDGKDLIVRVPVGEMITDSLYPVSDITLNPYLLSADIYDKGYLFVPDGSGGIINFNTGKTSTSVLSIPVYGPDVLESNHFYRESFIQSTLPVVGMKKNDIAILGIIEEGAELATVTANVAGKVDEFNKVNVTFKLLYMEKIPMTVGFGNYMIKYANSGYKGNITMRYRLLEGENANYTGMAKAYKEYLKQNGLLKQNPVSENAPLFVEMIATVPKEKMFLGIPYTSYYSMTSFAEAQEIISSLKENNISSIVVQYTDWANGGIKNTPFTKVKPIGSIGGRKGLEDFISYAKTEGVDFFPGVNLSTTYSFEGISANRDISRLIDNSRARLPGFNMVTKQTDHVNEWLISPSFLEKYMGKVLGWTGKLGIDNLAVGNFGTLLYGDYNNKRQLMRSDALPLFVNAYKLLGQDRKLLFSNANSYAFAYASYIADLPVRASGRRAVDYSVPFVQMVLEGDVPYSLEAYNNNSLQGIDKYLLKAIETKSSLKWILTDKDEAEFNEAYLIKDIRMKPYFQTRFTRWNDTIGEVYAEYNEFYKKVKDAQIQQHEVFVSGLVKVVYTNGVTVYINYSDYAVTADGLTIEPVSYLVRE
ncbi:MAG TPA: hypothetical protein GX505_05305 [Clostridiales bacterium]|nr:hypothetical protein [Clostridiales bacterium]